MPGIHKTLPQVRRLMRLGTSAACTALVALVSVAQAGEASSSAAKPFRPSYYACVDKSEGVTLALNDCIGAEHDFQDKRLNTAYQGLRKSLTDSAKTALRDEERAWIAERDKACAPAQDGGTADLLDSNQCELTKTAARAAELEGRRSR